MDLETIVAQTNNWNFEGDLYFFNCMKNIGDNLATTAKNTTKKFEALNRAVMQSSVAVDNVANTLQYGLHHTQYMENRSQDEEEYCDNNKTFLPKNDPETLDEDSFLRIFLENNLKAAKENSQLSFEDCVGRRKKKVPYEQKKDEIPQGFQTTTQSTLDQRIRENQEPYLAVPSSLSGIGDDFKLDDSTSESSDDSASNRSSIRPPPITSLPVNDDVFQQNRLKTSIANAESLLRGNNPLGSTVRQDAQSDDGSNLFAEESNRMQSEPIRSDKNFAGIEKTKIKSNASQNSEVAVTPNKLADPLKQPVSQRDDQTINTKKAPKFAVDLFDGNFKEVYSLITEKKLDNPKEVSTRMPSALKSDSLKDSKNVQPNEPKSAEIGTKNPRPYNDIFKNVFSEEDDDFFSRLSSSSSREIEKPRKNDTSTNNSSTGSQPNCVKNSTSSKNLGLDFEQSDDDFEGLIKKLGKTPNATQPKTSKLKNSKPSKVSLFSDDEDSDPGNLIQSTVRKSSDISKQTGSKQITSSEPNIPSNKGNRENQSSSIKSSILNKIPVLDFEQSDDDFEDLMKKLGTTPKIQAKTVNSKNTEPVKANLFSDEDSDFNALIKGTVQVGKRDEIKNSGASKPTVSNLISGSESNNPLHKENRDNQSNIKSSTLNKIPVLDFDQSDDDFEDLMKKLEKTPHTSHTKSNTSQKNVKPVKANLFSDDEDSDFDNLIQDTAHSIPGTSKQPTSSQISSSNSNIPSNKENHQNQSSSIKSSTLNKIPVLDFEQSDDDFEDLMRKLEKTPKTQAAKTVNSRNPEPVKPSLFSDEDSDFDTLIKGTVQIRKHDEMKNPGTSKQTVADLITSPESNIPSKSSTNENQSKSTKKSTFNKSPVLDFEESDEDFEDLIKKQVTAAPNTSQTKSVNSKNTEPVKSSLFSDEDSDFDTFIGKYDEKENPSTSKPITSRQISGSESKTTSNKENSENQSKKVTNLSLNKNLELDFEQSDDDFEDLMKKLGKTSNTTETKTSKSKNTEPVKTSLFSDDEDSDFDHRIKATVQVSKKQDSDTSKQLMSSQISSPEPNTPSNKEKPEKLPDNPNNVDNKLSLGKTKSVEEDPLLRVPPQKDVDSVLCVSNVTKDEAFKKSLSKLIGGKSKAEHPNIPNITEAKNKEQSVDGDSTDCNVHKDPDENKNLDLSTETLEESDKSRGKQKNIKIPNIFSDEFESQKETDPKPLSGPSLQNKKSENNFSTLKSVKNSIFFDEPPDDLFSESLNSASILKNPSEMPAIWEGDNFEEDFDFRKKFSNARDDKPNKSYNYNPYLLSNVPPEDKETFDSTMSSSLPKESKATDTPLKAKYNESSSSNLDNSIDGTENLLKSLCKNRVKPSNKRSPSTRLGRQKQLQESEASRAFDQE